MRYTPLIIALLFSTGCWRRFKRLGSRIVDDIMIELVYCPINKRLKERKQRMSRWREKRDEVEQTLGRGKELYTSADVGQCLDQDLKIMKVKLPTLEGAPNEYPRSD